MWSHLHNQLLAKSLKMSWSKVKECPLDVSQRVKLSIHSGEAHGRVDLKMSLQSALGLSHRAPGNQGSRRVGKGQGVTHQAILKHTFPLNRGKTPNGRRHYSQLLVMQMSCRRASR